MYSAHINTQVNICLSSASHGPPPVRLSCSEAPSAAFGRLESCPTTSRDTTFNSHVRRGSLSLTVRVSVSSSSTSRPYTSNCGHRSTSAVFDAHGSEDLGRDTGVLAAGRRHNAPAARQDVGLVDSGVVVGTSGRRRRDAPAPPHLPDYAEIERPPPYNPDFRHAPTTGAHGRSSAEGRSFNYLRA